MRVCHHVLVIEPGDSAADAAHKLASELGHEVSTHPSPVGVAKVLRERSIDMVVLPWRLGAAQDQKLRSLVKSWERTRPLRVIILAEDRERALADAVGEINDTKVVSVGALLQELPRVLGQSSREFAAIVEERPDDNQFVERLRERLDAAARQWEGIAQRTLDPREILFPLGGALGQAEILKLDKLATLLREISAVAQACEMSGRPTPEQYDSVTAALRFAVHAISGPPYDADSDPTNLITRLRHSLSPR